MKAYVKNHNLGLEVPYLYGSTPRTYFPDFIVQVDDGQDDPLNLIVEIKGYRGEDVREKNNAMEAYWLPGVNALGQYGRRAFAELTDVYDIESGLKTLIAEINNQGSNAYPESYDGPTFKELLAAAHLEGVDLTRTPDLPRDIEF